MPHPEDKTTAKPFHAMNRAERRAHHAKRKADKKHRPLGSGDKPKKPK